MPIFAIEQHIPVIEPTSFIHPNATIIGDVIIGKHCYIGPNACLRGDFGRIEIHDFCNVQDNCVLHSFPLQACVLEEYSHIGHGAILHGCTIRRHSLVGINAVVMDFADIGAESIIGAASFVKSRFNCPARSMLLGSPAKIVRQVSDEEFQWKTRGTDEYIELTRRCQTSLREVTPLTTVEENRPMFQPAQVHQPKNSSN